MFGTFHQSFPSLSASVTTLPLQGLATGQYDANGPSSALPPKLVSSYQEKLKLVQSASRDKRGMRLEVRLHFL